VLAMEAKRETVLIPVFSAKKVLFQDFDISFSIPSASLLSFFILMHALELHQDKTYSRRHYYNIMEEIDVLLMKSISCSATFQWNY